MILIAFIGDVTKILIIKMKELSLSTHSSLKKTIMVSLFLGKSSQNNLGRLHSDILNVASLEDHHVKTVLVDFHTYRDYDDGYYIEKGYEVIAVAGHAHNPDTQENSGYFFFSMLPLGWIPKQLTIPELPYGFTAVQNTKLDRVYSYYIE